MIFYKKLTFLIGDEFAYFLDSYLSISSLIKLLYKIVISK